MKPVGRRLTGTQSPRSFNNHLGVPLTLLAARAAHDFVVAEIGTNHPGEIASLAAIARPDAAVITSIGREHMEYFETLDAVAREESAVLDYMVEPGFVAIEADAWQRITAVRDIPAHLHVVRFGQGEHADVQYDALTETPAGLRFTITASGSPTGPPNQQSAISNQQFPFTLPLLGRHNAGNALAAIVVGQWLGIAPDTLARQLANVTPIPGRLEVRHLGTPPDSVLVLHDAYNANPDSMHAAIETLVSVSRSEPETRNAKRSPRRIAILGDMAELGAGGPDAHRQLGDELAKHRETIDLVLLVGRLTLFTAEALTRHWPNDRVHLLGPLDDAGIDRIAAMLEPGDIVLLKASRSTALERVLPAIEKRFAP